MVNCEECMIYNLAEDKFRQQFNDTSEEELHYCLMFNDNIPEAIWDDIEECQFKIKD